LDEACIEAALIVRDMLCDVHSGAAIFTANGQTLQRADKDEGHGGNPAASMEAGEKTNRCGCTPHDAQGDKKRVLATHHVTNSPKEERSKGPHNESHRKRGKVRDVGKGLIAGGIKLLRENDGKAAEDKKIVPLDHRSGGGSQNHAPDAAARKNMGIDRRDGRQRIPNLALVLRAWLRLTAYPI
jgi:hypothetical protein